MKFLGRLYYRVYPGVPPLSKIIFETLCNQFGLGKTKTNRDCCKRVFPPLVPVARWKSEVWFVHCIDTFSMLHQLLPIWFSHRNNGLPLKRSYKQQTQYLKSALQRRFRLRFLPSLTISIISSGWKLSSSTSVAS